MNPMYGKRFAGQRERDRYDTAANEVSALNLVAPAMPGSYAPHLAAARDQAIASARDQTVLNYQIRRGYLQDAEAAERDRQNDIRYWAEYAMRNRNAKSAFDLQRRQEGRQDRAMAQRGEQFGEQVGLRRDEMAQRGEQFGEQMGLRRDEMAMREQQFGEQMDLRRAQTGSDQGVLPSDQPWVTMRQFEQAGFDTSGWVADGDPTVDGRKAIEFADHFYRQGARGEELVQKTTEAIGLSRGWGQGAFAPRDTTTPSGAPASPQEEPWSEDPQVAAARRQRIGQHVPGPQRERARRGRNATGVTAQGRGYRPQRAPAAPASSQEMPPASLLETIDNLRQLPNGKWIGQQNGVWVAVYQPGV